MIELSLVCIKIFLVVKSFWWIINRITHFLLIKDLEVVHSKLVNSLHLSLKELDYYHEVLKICMIADYIYLMSSLFQIISSMIYAFNDHQHFLIMYIIVSFSWLSLSQSDDYWVSMYILKCNIYLLKHHCSFCKFKDIYLQSYDFCKIKVLKNKILSKDDFQFLKSISSTVSWLNLLRLIFENVSLLCIRKELCFKMINQEWDYFWIILYESTIKVNKVEKCLNFFHHSWLWSILNDLHSILLHWNFFFFHFIF